MAQSQQPERGGEAEFVRRIVTDPKNVPDVMRLYGYPGASSEEHHDRLYLNTDLSSYVEVPRSAILHRMEVPREQDPNGAVVLWVRRDAALIQKAAAAAQALAQYFAGAIAGAAAGAGAMPAGIALLPTQIAPCVPTPVCTPACQTVLANCTQLCVTHITPCLATHQLTACIPCTAGCPTHLLTPCVPCPTHQLTACIPCTQATPCPTHQLTPCVPCTQATPCPTHQLTPCVPCTQATPCPTHQPTCAPICTRVTPCFPTPQQECPFTVGGCPRTLPVECQATPVGACGGSIGAACGPQGSIACGASAACGAGIGQQGIAEQAAIAPQAAAFGFRTQWLCYPTPACSFGCPTLVGHTCYIGCGGPPGGTPYCPM
jgi:hypothetical protein